MWVRFARCARFKTGKISSACTCDEQRKCSCHSAARRSIATRSSHHCCWFAFWSSPSRSAAAPLFGQGASFSINSASKQTLARCVVFVFGVTPGSALTGRSQIWFRIDRTVPCFVRVTALIPLPPRLPRPLRPDRPHAFWDQADLAQGLRAWEAGARGRWGAVAPRQPRTARSTLGA